MIRLDSSRKLLTRYNLISQFPIYKIPTTLVRFSTSRGISFVENDKVSENAQFLFIKIYEWIKRNYHYSLSGIKLLNGLPTDIRADNDLRIFIKNVKIVYCVVMNLVIVDYHSAKKHSPYGDLSRIIVRHTKYSDFIHFSYYIRHLKPTRPSEDDELSCRPSYSGERNKKLLNMWSSVICCYYYKVHSRVRQKCFCLQQLNS